MAKAGGDAGLSLVCYRRVMSRLTHDLAATLTAVVVAAPGLRDDWWIFGSAGMALAGVPGLTPPDLDLLVSERDARHLIGLWSADVDTSPGAGLFRSKIFAKAQIAPLPIEIMSGFEVMTGGAWSPVRLKTRVAVRHGAGTVFIPAVAEQVEICRTFGRPKDLARIPALEALI